MLQTVTDSLVLQAWPFKSHLQLQSRLKTDNGIQRKQWWTDLLFFRPVRDYCFVPHRSDTAILYNDRSVLESHHVSAAYRLLQDDDEMNILYNLSKDDWRSVSLTREIENRLLFWKKKVRLALIFFNLINLCMNIKILYFLHRTWVFIPSHVWLSFQGAESSGGGDGVGHRYVVPLPAGEGHEEFPPTTWGVSSTSVHSQ